MMSFLLKMGISKAGGAGIAIAITLVSAYFGYQELRISGLKDKLETSIVDNSTLKKVVYTQSLSIAEMERQSLFNAENKNTLNNAKREAQKKNKEHLIRYDKYKKNIERKSISNPKNAGNIIDNEYASIIDELFTETNPTSKDDTNKNTSGNTP